MTRVWMYVLNSSKNPDDVQCVVPWRVDEQLIFFGPCKRRIRARLREEYLGDGRNHCSPSDDLFIISVNGSNAKRIRKVVSAGKLIEVMTFAEATEHLDGERFSKLREDDNSPLHVRPIIKSGELIGYEHISYEHLEDDEWIGDLVSNRRKVSVKGRTVRRRPGVTPWDAFGRDCCMLLDNLFFAQEQGIQFDKEAVDILKAAQPGRQGIDDYAVFGLDAAGQANGMRGRFLEMDGDLADRFLTWLTDRARRIAARQPGEKKAKPCAAILRRCTGRSDVPW